MGPTCEIDGGFNRETLCVGRGHDRGDRVLDDPREVGRPHLEPGLARHDARHIQHVFDDLCERDGVAIDHLERLRRLVLRGIAPVRSMRA